ncbi:MAG: hypothetical protein ACK5ME_11900 [Parahaliea sp.]
MKIWVYVLLSIILAGCQSGPRSGLVADDTARAVACCARTETKNKGASERSYDHSWMDELIGVYELDIATVTAHRVLMGSRPLLQPLDRFRYALLNQRIGEIQTWINARDIFRELAVDESLQSHQRMLANVLLAYNQSMINAHVRNEQLAEDLAVTQQELKLLSEKIEALTHLEQSISERKVKGEELPVGEE